MNPCHKIRNTHRQAGVGALLAMMYIVIFASLACAMAIVAQGNLRTADTHLKVNRTLAAAETGLQMIEQQLNAACLNTTTSSGTITSANAPALWTTVSLAVQTAMSGALHNVSEPYMVGTQLNIGPISLGDGCPNFSATLTPHPLAGENYSSSYYTRAPYNAMTPPISSSNPLDATWIRVVVKASEGPAYAPITRAIQVDFQMGKSIPFAILSRSRVMLGQNVSIWGNIGSSFSEVNLANGHPVQMKSDFMGLDPALDAQLNAFHALLVTNDQNGDNRLNLADPREIAGISNPSSLDKNGDGYIDDYDYFLAFYDKNGDGRISGSELNITGNVQTAELMNLIDTSGLPTRPGYGDGFIDNQDDYAKVHGTVMISASEAAWNSGAAAGSAYQDYFQGTIKPNAGQPAVVFQSTSPAAYQFSAADFDTSTYLATATGSLATQAAAQATSVNPLGQTVFEAVPYGSQHPYDYYYRPVYSNMTFTNIAIPAGTNALFQNCTFIGCTYVQSSTDNGDPNFNYAGMLQADGTLRYPDKSAVVNNTTVTDTRTVANNLRFDSCTFQGAVVTDSVPYFTQVRDKLDFTGDTTWNIAGSTNLTAAQKALYTSSALLAPNYSVELGTFVNPSAPNQAVNLVGTIVAGIIDMRGNVNVDGSIITTFQPVSNQGPVLGNTSPNFNTTIGYFSSAEGDAEGELPAAGTGLGNIKIRYDNTIPLPNGILSPIQITPNIATYFEAGS